MAVVELLGDGQPEHGVAEELQPLVGGQPAVLVGVAAVRQRDGQQFIGQVDAQRLEQRRASVTTLTCRSRRRDAGELGPARVDLLVVVARLGGGQRHAALRAQPRTVRPAQRRERQRQPDGVDDRLLEVDGVVNDAAHLVGVGGLVGGAVGIGEQLGEVDLDVVR